jgi:hypothetical protein
MQTPGRRRTRARPIADFLRSQIDPLVAKQGFGEAALILRWREIAGERIAALCAPERLKRPPRAARSAGPGGKPAKAGAAPDAAEAAQLILQVEPGFGLEVQYAIPLLIERINAFLGWRCVSRIAIRQAPLAAMRDAAARAAPRFAPADPAARARAETITASLPDAPLRAALIRLGENALKRGPQN